MCQLQSLHGEGDSKSCPHWAPARSCSGLSHCSPVLLVDQVNIKGSEHGQSGSLCISLKLPPSLKHILVSDLRVFGLFVIPLFIFAGVCYPRKPKHACHPFHSEIMCL